MKNAVVCKNCGTENALYQGVCTKCGSFLRTRVVNIDLFPTLWQTIESPATAFSNIISAEHKNYVIYLYVAAAVKYLLDAFILKGHIYSGGMLNWGFFSILPVAVILSLVFFYLFSFLFKASAAMTGCSTRAKDIFAQLAFTQLPQLFALIFIFPVEMVLFGEYLFSADLPPYLIKPMPAWILAGLEVLMFIWSVVLGGIAFHKQTRLKILSIVMTILMHAGIAGLILFFAALG